MWVNTALYRSVRHKKKMHACDLGHSWYLHKDHFLSGSWSRSDENSSGARLKQSKRLNFKKKPRNIKNLKASKCGGIFKINICNLQSRPIRFFSFSGSCSLLSRLNPTHRPIAPASFSSQDTGWSTRIPTSLKSIQMEAFQPPLQG